MILGRQQLFTENTLTPLLPLFYDPQRLALQAARPAVGAHPRRRPARALGRDPSLRYPVREGGFGHIIAGSVEAMYGAWRGALSWGDVMAFVIPTFLGNSIGGVAFVTAVTTAEIASERKELGRDVRTPDAARGSATSREHERHRKTPGKPR